MILYKKAILAITLSIVWAIMLVSCESNLQHDIDYSRAASLARTLSYEKIVSGLKFHDWNKEQDPALLMVYCEALVEMRHKLPSVFRSQSIPHRVKQFAQGYYNLVGGDWRTSLNLFLELTKAPRMEDKVWGLIGMLDHAFYTEAISNMKGPLNVIQKISEKQAAIVPSWVLPYYQTYFELHSGNYSLLKSFIEKNRLNLEPDVYFDIYIQLLIRHSRFDEARTILGDMDPELRESQILLLHEAEIIRLQKGPNDSQEFLKIKIQQNPKRWLLQQEYANLLIDEGKTSDGFGVLKKIARDRPFDVITQLAYAEQLTYQGQIEKAQKIILKELRNPAELFYYNIIYARLFYTKGRLDKARVAIKRAQVLFPKNYEAFWIEFHIAKKNANYIEAEKILNNILKIEPDDVSALAELMELNFLKQKWDTVLEIKKRIGATNRYIDPNIREKIERLNRRTAGGRGVGTSAIRLRNLLMSSVK